MRVADTDMRTLAATSAAVIVTAVLRIMRVTPLLMDLAAL
jgi:hypothetical protein